MPDGAGLAALVVAVWRAGAEAVLRTLAAAALSAALAGAFAVPVVDVLAVFAAALLVVLDLSTVFLVLAAAALEVDVFSVARFLLPATRLVTLSAISDALIKSVSPVHVTCVWGGPQG